ncbi:MAG: DUF692 domain-containing protein [bacterium]|nr:DUF692 domain-containing protein [bacterium]
MALPIGYAIREQNRYVFDDPCINAVEITFERADDPLRIETYVGDIEMEHVSVHALKLSPASPDPPAERYLKALKAIAQENGAKSISDHLGFTRNGNHGVEMGHFAPPPMTAEALQATVRNVNLICDYFSPLEFYLENIAYLFSLKGELSEAEFLSEVLQQTGCGWLLDVTNVYANARNFGFDAREFIDAVMPHARRVQMHLAGGYFDDKAEMYIDSHSHPIPDSVFELYEHSLVAAGDKVDAVFIERDQNFPDEAGWRSEARRVFDIADSATRSIVG